MQETKKTKKTKPTAKTVAKKAKSSKDSAASNGGVVGGGGGSGSSSSSSMGLKRDSRSITPAVEEEEEEEENVPQQQQQQRRGRTSTATKKLFNDDDEDGEGEGVDADDNNRDNKRYNRENNNGNNNNNIRKKARKDHQEVADVGAELEEQPKQPKPEPPQKPSTPKKSPNKKLAIDPFQKYSKQYGAPAKKKEEQLFRKCTGCYQRSDVADANTWSSDSVDASEEAVAISHPTLQLQFDGDGGEGFDFTVNPIYRLTSFAFYDPFNHMCSIDAGIVENDQDLYFSGYIKPVFDEDPHPRGGIPVQKGGRVTEWWFSGFDGGINVILGISTEFAEYVLVNPHPSYQVLG